MTKVSSFFVSGSKDSGFGNSLLVTNKSRIVIRPGIAKKAKAVL